jgi:hypothetical protein
MAVYQHVLHDPADEGVYEALLRHFTEYGLAFIARSSHADLPDANHQVIVQFAAHGFAGSYQGLAQRRIGDENGSDRGRRRLRIGLVELTRGDVMPLVDTRGSMRDIMRPAAMPRRRSCSDNRTSMTSDRTCATCPGAASAGVWKPFSVRMALVNRPSAGSGSRCTNPPRLKALEQVR